MKFIIVIITCYFLLFNLSVEGQVLYENKSVKIEGHVSYLQECIYFKIENLGDSTMLLNSKMINYAHIRKNEWAADLSLLSSGVNIMKPGNGHFMNFKRLSLGESYTVAIYNIPFLQELDSIKLYIGIDYMIIPTQLSLCGNILYESFVELVNSHNLKVNSFKGELVVDKKQARQSQEYFLKNIYNE